MEQWIKHFRFKSDVLSEEDIDYDMIGQEDVVNELLYRVEAGDLVFIEGEAGTGKTRLLHEIIKKHKGRKQVVYLDCKNLKKGVDVEQLLIEKFSWWNKLLKKMPKNMIVLLDNINALDHKNSEAIKYFFDQGNIQSVIFTADNRVRVKFSGSLWQRIGRRVIHIPKLKSDSAVKMIKERIGSQKITNNGLKMIFKKSEGNLKKFLWETRQVLSWMADERIYAVTDDNLEEMLFGKKPEEKSDEKSVKESNETKEQKEQESEQTSGNEPEQENWHQEEAEETKEPPKSEDESEDKVSSAMV